MIGLADIEFVAGVQTLSVYNYFLGVFIGQNLRCFAVSKDFVAFSCYLS